MLSLYQGGRVYIFEYNEDYTHHSCTYEVVSEGVSKEKNKQQSIPVNETRWWCEQILSGKPIILTSLKQLPEEAEDEYKFLDAQGICSLMVAPLMAGDRVWGFMGIDLVESYREWSNEDFNGSLHWRISSVFASNCARPKIVLSANSLFKQSVPFYAVRLYTDVCRP